MRKGQLQNAKRYPGQMDSTGTPKVFRDFLFDRGMSPTRAAVELDVTISTISKWENHLANPTIDHLSMIELVFGLPDGRILFPRCWPNLIPEKYKIAAPTV